MRAQPIAHAFHALKEQKGNAFDKNNESLIKALVRILHRQWFDALRGRTTGFSRSIDKWRTIP